MAEPLLLTVDSACERLQVGRSLMYALLLQGAVRSVKVGRRRLIPVAALEEYVTELIKGQADGEPRRVEIEAEA